MTGDQVRARDSKLIKKLSSGKTGSSGSNGIPEGDGTGDGNARGGNAGNSNAGGGNTGGQSGQGSKPDDPASTKPPPRKLKPCEHLRAELERLLADETIAEELKASRAQDKATTEIGIWLGDGETSLAILPVLLAVTDMKKIEQGFSMMQQAIVQMCQATDQSFLAQFENKAVRPGRPCMFSVHMEKHFVLVVAQLDERSRPTISVLDARPFHYDQDNCENLF